MRRFVAEQRGISSAGRAPALQAGGRRFDPVILHHLELIRKTKTKTKTKTKIEKEKEKRENKKQKTKKIKIYLVSITKTLD